MMWGGGWAGGYYASLRAALTQKKFVPFCLKIVILKPEDTIAICGPRASKKTNPCCQGGIRNILSPVTGFCGLMKRAECLQGVLLPCDAA